MPPDFSKGKIYKLVLNKTDDIYIGSCLVELSKRLYGHKSKSNKASSKKLFLDDAIVTIVLIENYPCENKNMLKARELYHITNNICININKPFVCDIVYGDGKEWNKQYNTDNIEHRHLIWNQYYTANKEIILKKAKQHRVINDDMIKSKRIKYRATHRDRINARKRELYAEKKLAQNLYII